tara:strand:+ start:854 stop:1315 length:462 start_codon:yes stop_codon:yes gene_type:complete
MTPQSTFKTMDFKLHQLSGSNLSSIFNASYIDAETTEDGTACVVKGDINLCVWASKEENLFRFYNQVASPDGITEEEAKRLVSEINKRLNLTKAYLTGEKADDGDPIIGFEYDYVVFNHDTISAKTIIQLTRMVETSIKISCQVYQELTSKTS